MTQSTRLARLGALALVLIAGFAGPAFAADEPKIDTGDTAWMLTATALVLLMTIPGVALFYAGMVRKKNVLATMMQSFSITALVTVIWMVLGYSLAFGEGGSFIGDFSRLFLSGMDWDKPFTLGSGDAAVATTIPEPVFMMFQMTFAIITPALICGAFADRMKFSAMLWFIGLWSILVYAPVAHWVWHPNGWLFEMGALDFAGGTVVHINAGIAGLVAAPTEGLAAVELLGERGRRHLLGESEGLPIAPRGGHGLQRSPRSRRVPQRKLCRVARALPCASVTERRQATGRHVAGPASRPVRPRTSSPNQPRGSSFREKSKRSGGRFSSRTTSRIRRPSGGGTRSSWT